MFAPAGAGTKKEYNIFIFYNIFLGKILLLRVRVRSAIYILRKKMFQFIILFYFMFCFVLFSFLYNNILLFYIIILSKVLYDIFIVLYR